MKTTIPSVFATLLLAFGPAPSTAAPPRVVDITFDSHGVTLAGSVALPASPPIRAAVIFVHGSGPQSRNLDLARRFAEAGIAALVYDKRGAGDSGGRYEADQSVSGPNIVLLADDAAAALEALANYPALSNVPLGIAGISQAGWIAPWAARKAPHASFLLLWSGPVCKVSEEDIFSKATTDGDMDNPPTYASTLAARKETYVWPDFLGRDTDSFEELGKLAIPGLWLFGDNDGSIPVDLSIQKLQALRAAGHPYDYVLFSGAGHNNIDVTFATAIDWIGRNAAPRR